MAVKRLQDIAATCFVVLIPPKPGFTLKANFLKSGPLGLGAGDALHLAIAPNNSANPVYSLDQGLVKAAILYAISAGSGL